MILATLFAGCLCSTDKKLTPLSCTAIPRSPNSRTPSLLGAVAWLPVGPFFAWSEEFQPCGDGARGPSPPGEQDVWI